MLKKRNSNVINIVDIDTLAFRADAEKKAFREQLILFYSVDEKYYYKNQDGIITDITPVSYYSYNSSSKRNADSLTLCWRS
jgi:hypothetical protein